MDFRPYDRERDRQAVLRIYREVGWLEEGQEEALAWFLAAGKTLVADIEGIQLQDLLWRPLTNRHTSKHSKFENKIETDAYWQVRILDLPGCMARTHLPCGEARFNLRLEDPIEAFLDENAPWHGCGGQYVVTLGSDSSAVPGSDPALTTLTASVGAFTRMWMGVRPASGLAITDQLSGPRELLSALECALLLPEPHLGWEI